MIELVTSTRKTNATTIRSRFKSLYLAFCCSITKMVKMATKTHEHEHKHFSNIVAGWITSDDIEQRDRSAIVDMKLAHPRPYREDIYKLPNVVSLHTLPRHHIDPHKDWHIDSWCTIDCHRIHCHFGIHLERNDSMDCRCIPGNKCIPVVRDRYCHGRVRIVH